MEKNMLLKATHLETLILNIVQDRPLGYAVIKAGITGFGKKVSIGLYVTLRNMKKERSFNFNERRCKSYL